MSQKIGPAGAQADVGLSALGLWSVPEAAARLSLSAKTVWRLCRSGALESVKVGRRLIPPAAVADYLSRSGSKRWFATAGLAEILGGDTAPAVMGIPPRGVAGPRAASNLGVYVIVALPLSIPQLPQVLSALEAIG